MEDTPKEKVHESGLPKPPDSQMPHHPVPEVDTPKEDQPAENERPLIDTTNADQDK